MMKMVHIRLGVLATLTAISLIACATESEVLVSTTSTIAVATTLAESSTTVSAVPSFSATLGEPITDYDDPVDIAVRNGKALQSAAQSYIAERSGKIFELATDGIRGSQVLDISDLTIAQGEQGLLGLAFAPDGSSAYVNYTNLAGDTVIASFLITDDGTFDQASQNIITTIKQPYPNHNGGDIIVDADGALYVFMGDGGFAKDPERYALDITSPLGKIWKITPTDGRWNTGEAWAVGLRNPWRAALDPVTNDLWIADVGQDHWEEINVVPFEQVQGVSFGWSAREGTHEFNADQQTLHETFTAVEPVYEYEHVDNNCSISGGVVYRGSQVPFTGTWYIFSDYCTGEVQALCVNDQRQNCGVIDLGIVEKSVGIVTDALGEAWVLSQNGLIVPIITS